MSGFHHLRRRIRVAKGLDTFPSRDATRRRFDYLMYGVGIFAPLALLPQILQLYTTKSAAGLSLITWILLTTVNLLWALYGGAHKDRHILFASVLMGMFNATVVIGILLY